MSIKDTAVGAILEIPSQALDNIYKAQRAIEGLHVTSRHAADEVSKHWGTTAVDGLTKFINKVNEARGVIGDLSGKPVNINMTGLEQSMTQAANTAQTQTQRISDAAQSIASLNIDTTNFKTIEESIRTAGMTFEEFEKRIKNYEAGRQLQQIDTPEAQAMNNAIERMKEFIALKKKSDEQLARSATPSDKAILDEQKSLMSQILQLTKDINAEKKKQGREKALGSAIPQEDIDRLRKYREDLERLNISYDALKGKIDGMSAGGAKLFNEADVKNSLALTREQGDAQEKLNQALQMTAKLTSDVKLKGGNVTSSEYGVYRNEQVTVYAQMIEMIKKKGEVEAQVASQGYAQTAAQTNLLQTIDAEYKRLESTLTSVTGKYLEIDRAVKSAFDNTKIMQEAENAAKLADAQKKAEGNAKQLVSEYTKLTKQLQDVNAAMNNFLAAGGSKSNASYQALEQEYLAIQQRRKEIEKMDIAEVNQYRQQMMSQFYQADISAYVQYNAQKKAAALQTAQEESNARRQALQSYLQSYQGAMQQADKVLSGRSGTSMFATNIENIRRAINDLKAASGSLNLLNPADVTKAEQMKKKIAELETLLKRYKDAATPDKPVISPQDAINAAKTATTLKQLEKAYKDLKEAMSGVDSSKLIWSQMNTQLGQTKKQIDDIKKKMGKFHNETQRTSNMMGNLQNRIAAAFSVSAILGFAKKVTEVRAQFELQRVALGAIIQDKDEANKIFLQVQQMALESPFSIMQLERSTKQIAAFGFEAKQLVPTMKMVADIGAGLGVELDRIVLVLGHMKARGYLEGTMVRQFTNMGFNVLGELAKYYTELEGRMVSVADVQERVKKKMVEFGDVEEVLKRVTSAGGMFYDMQKKQSDSIWGQMQRITDAYDLMLNEIGQQNEGSIKTALTAIRTLINSWRTLLPIIKAVGAAMMMYFARVSWAPMVAGLAKATSGFRVLAIMIRNADAAQRLLNASQKASGWGTLLALISAAVVVVWEFATAQSKLNEELERTQSEGISDMYGLIFQYRSLSETVKDSTKSYEERKKALDEIKRVYKDILPDYMTEVEYVKSISDGYKEATNAIQAYSIAKIENKKRETINTEYGKKIEDEITSVSSKIAWRLSDEIDIPKEHLQGIIANIWRVINERIKSGDLDKADAKKEFQKQFQDIFDVSSDVFEKIMSRITASGKFGLGPEKELREIVDDFLDIYDEIAEKLGDNTKVGFPGIKLESEQLEKEAQPAIDKYHNLEKAVAEYTSALESLYNRKAELEKQGGTFGQIGLGEVGGKTTLTFPGADKVTQDSMDDVFQKLGKLAIQIDDYGETFTVTTQDINTALQSNMDKTEYLGTVNENVFQKILNNFNKWGGALVNNDFMRNFVENALQNLNLLTEPQQKIIDIARKVAAANGVAMNSFDLLKIGAAASYTDAAKEAKKLSDQAADNILKIHATKMKLIELQWTAEAAQQEAEKIHGGGMTEEELKKYQKMMEDFWKALGGYEKSNKESGRNTDKELKRWQDVKKLLEDVSTAYDKARKSFSVDESNRQINNLFGKSFEELGFKIKDFYKDGTYGAESLIKAEKELLGLTKDNTEERKKFRSELQRSMADTQVEIDVKLKEDSEKKLKDDIDKMFDNYELSKTFKDIGLNVDLTYMVGGKPTTLGDIRRELTEDFLAAGGKNAAENVVKEYENAFKRLDEIEHKNQIERIKNYNKYLLESMSERVQIELKAMQDIKKIRDDETLDQFSKDQAIANRRKKMQEDLAKYDFDQFKGSDVYIDTFKDLEKASKEQLQYVIDKLKELQSVNKDLSPAQVKSMASEIRKAQDALGEKTSFKDIGKNLRDSVKYARNRNQLIKQQVSLQKQIDAQEKKRSDAGKVLYDLEAKRNSIQDKSSEEWENANAEVEKQQDLVSVLVSSVEKLKKEQEAVTNEISKGEQAWINFQGGLGNISENIGQIKESFDAVFDGLDSMGLVNDAFRDTYESISDIIGGVQTMISGLESIDITQPFSIVTGIIKSIGGIFQTIGGFFGFGDKKKERDIKKQQERVEALDKAYQRLEKSMDKALTFDQYNADFNKMQKNLDEQKQAYQEMIRLEEDKKKTDKEKVKEYKEQLQEIEEAEEELRKERIEAMGSTTDYLSEAQSFVDAWLEAYKETGDGLDALKENWDEFIENLFVKQAAAQIVSTKLKKVIGIINTAIEANKTGTALADAVNEARAEWEKYAAGMIPALEELFGSYGLGGKDGEFVLSDLQKGIQNITEPQAAAIEAYLNSMRFAVFRHTEQLDSLIAIVGAQYGVGVDNPVVTELKGIRIVLDTIDRRLDSVIETKAGMGTVLRIG